MCGNIKRSIFLSFMSVVFENGILKWKIYGICGSFWKRMNLFSNLLKIRFSGKLKMESISVNMALYSKFSIC
jgi:hypothetical protein